MGRNKKEITKDKEIRLRIESELKAKYVNCCKKRNIIVSDRLRELIQMDINGEI